MNRHSRRVAAAKARRAVYQRRLLVALNALDVRPCEIGHVFVEHDDGCTYDTGHCTCRPQMTMRTGGRLRRVGLDGEVEETPLC